MRILISGSRGLIGSALIASLGAGHEITRLVRGEARPNEIAWDPRAGKVDRAKLDGFDAVVHLAGESIASGRWTAVRKASIRDSRLQGTRLLAETLAGLSQPPRIFISASAMGYYGDRGDESLTETSTPGSDFLARVCQEWEAAAAPAANHGIRVVHPRFGIVLSPAGGVLGRMLTPFRFGLGAVIGKGTQWMSWIAIDDATGALAYCLENDAITGPVNLVAPQAITNRDFSKTLGRVLRRPVIFHAPAFALRFALGEMADALLLSSQRIEPTTLVMAGYQFSYPSLEPAIEHLLH